MVYGFAGMRSFTGVAQFAPFLPAQWTHYQFVVRLHDCTLQVRVEATQVSYQLLAGESLTIEHHGQSLCVTPQATIQTMPNRTTAGA